MVKLRVRRLYTDRNEPMEKETADDLCRKALGTLKGYGLSFLDGFETRKERLDKCHIMDNVEYEESVSYNRFEDTFRKKGRAKRPSLFFTPVRIKLCYWNSIFHAHWNAVGCGKDMLAIVDSSARMFPIGDFHYTKYCNVVLHELGHSIYGLEHHYTPETCVMNGLKGFLCEPCQSHARKIDEELRGK